MSQTEISKPRSTKKAEKISNHTVVAQELDTPTPEQQVDAEPIIATTAQVSPVKPVKVPKITSPKEVSPYAIKDADGRVYDAFAVSEKLDTYSMMTTDARPLDYVLPGMPVGTVGALVAPGGLGKTWAALEFAMLVAGGPDYLRMRDGISSIGRVLYLVGEDPADAVHHRIRVMSNGLPDNVAREISSRIEFHVYKSNRPDLMVPFWAMSLRKKVQHEGFRLIVIDTFRRFHKGAENDGTEMVNVIDNIESIVEGLPCAVLFLHHSVKSGGADQQASRGSSVLVDNIKGGQFNLVNMTEKEAEGLNFGKDMDLSKYVKIVNSKNNNSERRAATWFVRLPSGILEPMTMPDDGIPSGYPEKVIDPSRPTGGFLDSVFGERIV